MTTSADPLGVWAHRPAEPLRGAAAGPLAGLTFSAKDLYGVPGWPLTGSSRALMPEVAESPLVRRLLDLGATLVGKTHLHEIALGITGDNAYGGTRNPLDPARVAGGSSGGAAVSVALGQVDFALGTDTGGSIRIPAALCGVVGYKPTKGHPAWPTAGVLPLSWTCDHAGPLARDVATLARVQAALIGSSVAARGWAGLRVGVWNVERWVTPEAWAPVAALAETARQAGASVARFAFPDVLETYTPIVLGEAAQVHREALTLHDSGFTARIEGLLVQGRDISPAEFQAAFDRRASCRAQLEGLLTAFDVLLAPAVPAPAPRLGQDLLDLPEGETPLRPAFLRLTAPWSLLGVPVLTLPAPAGPLSVGVQLIGAWNADDTLLGLGLEMNAHPGP